MKKQTSKWRAVAAAAAFAATSTFGAAASAQTFIGQNFTASRSDLDPPLRPDLSGAVGADYFVELSGGRYGVYRKSDGARVQTSTIEQFWTNAGAPPLPERAFDPRVLYDPYARRWYALSADNNTPPNPSPGPNNFLFAVSNSPDPTAGWTGFNIDSDSNDDRWADLPTIGFNRDVVTLSANMYNLGTSNPPSTPTLVVIPKADLLAATPTVANRTKFEELPISTTGFTIQPAVDMDNGSLPLPLLARVNLSQLKRSSVTGTPASPAIDVAGGFIPISSNADPPPAVQPGTGVGLNTGGDTRFWSSVVRNNGELWAVHTVGLNGRAALRWYRIDEATNAVIQTGWIADPSLAFCFGSIAVNDFGDVVIGMSGTDATTFPSAFAVVGKTSGGVSTFGTPFMTKQGVSFYAPGNNRWGDYSATTLDPADPSIFWTFQEYVHATNERARQVTEIIVPQPGEARWKDSADGAYATDANWFGGAAPTATSHVIFSRATNPAGPGYTVSFGSDQTVDRLSVRQGKVTLDLNGSTMNATNPSDATPGLAVGEYGGTPSLDIVGGVVLADHGLVGNDGVINIDGGGGGAALHVSQTFRVRDRGIVNFNSGILSTGLLDVTGGRVNVAATGGAKVLRTTAVQTSGGGRIDLTTNAMTVDYAPADPSPLPDVETQIASAYAAGAWTGPGIATSSGNASQFGLGYGEASALSTVPPIFGNVDGTTVLVRYTRYGDANLDGLVNLDDFNRLAANFGQLGRVWTQGDFTYDTLVNLDDFNRLAGNFGLGAAGPEVTPQDWSALAAAVPEPTALVSLTFTLGMLVGRRRARRCHRTGFQRA